MEQDLLQDFFRQNPKEEQVIKDVSYFWEHGFSVELENESEVQLARDLVSGTKQVCAGNRVQQGGVCG